MEETSTTQMPLIGDPFPELHVNTTHGEMDLPGEYDGEWFVLFSHPGDFTPVCTTEFVSFQQHLEEFEDLGVNLIGLSVDRVHSHIKWTEWIEENLDIEITFPIIADDTGSVAKALGMIHPGQGTSTVRSVFIVDPDGVLRLMLYYPMEIGRNMDEIVRSIRALVTSDEDGVATPANWPNNELHGDKVLLPPPGDVIGADARREEAEEKDYEYYDWWFTLRDR
ncbi:peroxiredoxin [Haladaptatus sp. NG-WS-4]